MPSTRRDEVRLEDFQALAELRYQIRRFLNFSERAARATGLLPQQHQLLLALEGLPTGSRPTIGVLAERLQLRHHSTVELTSRLESRGLVERIASDADGREVLLHITPRGDALLRRLTLAHRDELRTAGPALLRALQSLDARRRGRDRRRLAAT
jgi:DNA-binding MarR family transcriptional regulator